MVASAAGWEGDSRQRDETGWEGDSRQRDANEEVASCEIESPRFYCRIVRPEAWWPLETVRRVLQAGAHFHPERITSDAMK